ncbi:MAG: sigma-70 family RNA polymerase sigma factor [Anaerolineae bacterium]|jgi:RNA polymerase sigma-70 factor (ECF subfamily)|nr:sigma-70 family RNA polymerase sigma factor [Anaerolineae bacterium]
MAEDRDLLDRARDFDPAALAEIYDAYAQRIYAYLYRRVGSAQIAEDLTGDVFLRMLEAIRARKAWQLSFKAWLYRIAHNVVVDWYRRGGARIHQDMDDGVVEAAARTQDSDNTEAWSREELRIAIRDLTEVQQQVLLLRFGEGLKVREIAEVLDKSVGAIEALQHRALSALKERLNE